MSENDLNVISILCDWVGSILMLGTFWGWIYSRISPRLQKKLKRGERRVAAVERFVKIKYGTDISKVPVILKRFEFDRELGIYEWTGIVKARSQRRADKKIRKRLTEFGLVSKEEKKRWDEIDLTRKESNRLIVIYSWNKITSWSKMKIVQVINSITVSIFTGTLSGIFFLLGFTLWNISKALGIFIITKSN